MDDILTEVPPPSRFFQDDLNNFAPPSPPLPSLFLLLSNPKPIEPLRPSLLVVAISSPSLHLFHHLSDKTLIGSLILPEIPFSGNHIQPSVYDKSCNIYSIDEDNEQVILVSIQCSVPAERSLLVAKLLLGDKIVPERVLILDSLQSQNFRGRLSTDETLSFKLETSSERKSRDEGYGGSPLLKGLDYYPSGSVVDGLAAALLGSCQMKNIKGALCVSWPEYGTEVISLLSSLLHQNVLLGPTLEFCTESNNGDGYLNRIKDLELYT
ncbi:uncharacterized protein LOC111462110 [Cucurbita moschata]|uniref:Uncharacterized protein LOC111462110 n=1 Tax=Cucurbita moschata TaxID=3662 RepID=A0A6J1HEF5_CUCMO|nr:uncharacterized protein LOC111462110 [Cucurbita moschata]